MEEGMFVNSSRRPPTVFRDESQCLGSEGRSMAFPVEAFCQALVDRAGSHQALLCELPASVLPLSNHFTSICYPNVNALFIWAGHRLLADSSPLRWHCPCLLGPAGLLCDRTAR